RDRQPQLPPQAPQPQPLPSAEPAPVESTQQFARPRFEASQIDPRDPLGLGLVEPVLPNVPNPPRPEPVRQERAPQQPLPLPLPHQEPMALPTGPSQAADRQPADEQPWHPQDDGGQQARPRQYQPRRPGTSAPEFRPSAEEQQAPESRPQQPQAQQAQPQQAPQQPQPEQQPGTGDAPWRPSANDERWRRAEQVREPSTSGVTMSGLPRRTPQANLVSGTAEASPLTGPQVSRAPEEVRGRLTNLRRGIQQGRRAGAEQAANQPGFQHGAQQPGFDSFGGRSDGNGADHQER
ncbi:hypothetical protein BU198_13615, partial [Streptomyces sp. CBMA156]|nr:hypothetical protein [Streptomyces sp. CBMA156]